MQNIKRIVLENFRVFSKQNSFELAPITILTGANSSGKSSLTKSLFLMKSLQTEKNPYRIRFDSNNNLLGGFDQIKNNNNDDPQITIGYSVNNIFLDEEVHIFFHIEREGDFDAVVRELGIFTENEELIYFKFDDKETQTYINLKYFFRKLKDLKADALWHIMVTNELDDFFLGHPPLYTLIETPYFQTNDVRKTYFEKEKISYDKYERLNCFFRKYGFYFPSREDKIIEQFADAVNEFKESECLYNTKLMIRILQENPENLNEYSLKSMIKNEYPDRKDDLVDPEISDSLNLIINELKLQDFQNIELNALENEKTLLIAEGGYSPERLINYRVAAGFESVPFFAAIKKLSKENRLSYDIPKNLECLVSFIDSFYKKVIYDVEMDIDKAVYIPLKELNPGLLVDFDHPLHELIKKYIGSDERNQSMEELFKRADIFDFEIPSERQFMEKWFKEFSICDDFRFEIPISGLGYSMTIIKAGKEVVLSNEGTGVNHLISMILGIVNSKEYRNIPMNLEQILYPRTIIIEEPEANLHPALQSKLAEMFIDAKNKFGLHFLLETHSEYLIRKLQFLVATKKIDKDDVIIHYFDDPDETKRGQDCPQCFTIKLDELGNLSREFGKGFFDEADNLTIDLFNITKLNKN